MIISRTGGNYLIVFIIAGSAYLVAFAAVQLLAPRLEPAVIPDDNAAGRGFEVIPR